MMTQHTMTEAQEAIKTRLDQGMGAREVAEELGISRNAVYQQIQRLRRDGHLEPDYTPTGVPVREQRSDPIEALATLLTESDTTTGALAIVEELRRVRDELDTITRRLTRIVPR